jgi:HEAT repeat protein
MPLLIRCPDCEADNRVAEDKKGETVTCKLCGVPFKVGKDAKFVEATEEDKRKTEETDGEKPKRKSRRTDLDDEDDDKPRKKKKRRDDDDEDRPRRGDAGGGVSGGQKAAMGVGGTIVFLAAVGFGIYWKWDKFTGKQNNNNTPTVNRQPNPVFNPGPGPVGPGPGPIGPGPIVGPKFGAESDIDRLVRELQLPNHPPPIERAANMNPTPERRAEVVKLLEDRVKDINPFASRAAVRALKRWGTKENAPAFAEAMARSNDRDTRFLCIETLGEYKDPASVRPLIEQVRLRNEPQERQKLTEALRKFPSAVAEPEVVAALEDPDVNVRIRMCQVLQAIGTKSSLPAVQAIIDTPQVKMMNPNLFNAALNARKAITERGV